MSFFGAQWVFNGFASNQALWFLGICFVLGILKGEFMIGKAGKKAIARIVTLPERSPFWQVFTPGQWGLVFGMMSLGMIIRFSGVPKHIRGLVLTAIGVALIWASRHFWRAFFKKD